MLAIDPNTAPAVLPGCARVNEHRSLTSAHPLEKCPHHTGRRSTLDPARLSVAERRLVRVQKHLHELVRVRARQVELGGSDVYARHETRHFPGRGGKSSLVEVVQVKVRQTVVALETSKILQVKISARPNQGTRR